MDKGEWSTIKIGGNIFRENNFCAENSTLPSEILPKILEIGKFVNQL